MTTDFLSAQDIADLLRVSLYTARQMLRDGTIRSAKVGSGNGRRRVVKREWLDEYIEACAEGGGRRRVRVVSSHRRRAS